jgi:membrane protease YdiL (CAAX protease family)
MALIISIINIISMVTLQGKLPPFILPMMFFWVIPFIITIYVEKQNLENLGIKYSFSKTPIYLIGIVLSFLLLTGVLVFENYLRIRFLGEPDEEVIILNQRLFSALLIQIVGIGFPEEIFFRGYLLSRFCNWVGKKKGLISSSFLFGFGHFASRLFQYGFEYKFSALVIGLHTILAGMVLGYLFYKTDSVFPPAISHILLNLFGPSISSNLLY